MQKQVWGSVVAVVQFLTMPCIIGGLWYAATRRGGVPGLLLPAPEVVFATAVRLWRDGSLGTHIWTSLQRVLTGYAISSLGAMTLACLCFRWSIVEKFSRSVLEALRVIPPLSLIPLLILWLGIDRAPKLAIVVLASFFPIYLSVYQALRTSYQEYERIVAYLHMNLRELLVHVLLPATAPQVLTGLRLGFGYAWRALVGAELIAASAGLGYLIEDASALAQTDVVFVGILSIAVLGVSIDSLFRGVARRLTPWQKEGTL